MFSKGLWKQHFVPALTLIPPHQLILSPDVDTLKKMCGGGGGIYLTVPLQGENSEKPVFTSSTQPEGYDREKRGGGGHGSVT